MRYAVCTHQRLHGAVESMPMVPPELGVGALEGRVTVRLRLLDTVMALLANALHLQAAIRCARGIASRRGAFVSSKE
jgi:hypothetical protein